MARVVGRLKRTIDYGPKYNELFQNGFCNLISNLYSNSYCTSLPSALLCDVNSTSLSAAAIVAAYKLSDATSSRNVIQLPVAVTSEVSSSMTSRARGQPVPASHPHRSTPIEWDSNLERTKTGSRQI